MAPSSPFFSRFPFRNPLPRHEPIRSPPPISPSIPSNPMPISPSRIRCLLILIFSPLILPLLFLTFPLVLALAICLWIRFCFRRRNRRRRRRRAVGGKKKSLQKDEAAAAAELRRCEEGLKEGAPAADEEEEEDGEIGRLLQVYLEDQLRLARSFVSNCGDAAEDEGGAGGGIRVGCRDGVDSNTVPLLT